MMTTQEKFNLFWSTLAKDQKVQLIRLIPFQGVVNIHPISWASYMTQFSLDNGSESESELISKTVKQMCDYGWSRLMKEDFSKFIFQVHPAFSNLLSSLNTDYSDLYIAYCKYYIIVAEQIQQLLISNDREAQTSGSTLAHLEYNNLRLAIEKGASCNINIIPLIAVISTYHLNRDELEACLYFTDRIFDLMPNTNINEEQKILWTAALMDVKARVWRAKGDWKKAKIYFLDLIAFFENPTISASFPSGKTEVHRMLAVIERDLGNFGRSKMYFDQVKQSYEIQNDQKNLAIVYQNLGRYYYETKNYDLAKSNFETAIEFAQLTDNQNVILKVKQMLAGLYYQIKDVVKSSELYKECLQIAKERKDNFVKAKAAQGLAILATLDKAYDDSFKYHKIALQGLLALSSKHEFDIAQVYYNMGNDCYNLELYDESETYYNRALGIYEKLNHLPRQAEILQNLANVSYYLDEIEKSIQYDDLALSIFIKLDRKQEIAEIIQNARLLVEDINDRKVLEHKIAQLIGAYDESQLQEILNLVDAITK